MVAAQLFELHIYTPTNETYRLANWINDEEKTFLLWLSPIKNARLAWALLSKKESYAVTAI
jgi:hypothetical protein